MSQAEETPDPIRDVFEKMLEGIGPSTEESRAAAEAYKQELSRSRASDTFHVELRMAYPPEFSWTHHTETLLGQASLTYEEYYLRVHPAYRDIYFQFAAASYQLVMQVGEQLAKQPAEYSVLVPLLTKDGTYFWFSQISRPSEFDINFHMTAHITTYRRISVFDESLLLSKPIVTLGDQRDIGLEDRLQKISAQGVIELFFQQSPKLKPFHRRLILQWWAVYTELGPATTHKDVAAQSDHSIAAVKKYVQPILEAARLVFPLSPLGTMNDLARLMSRLFGKPG